MVAGYEELRVDFSYLASEYHAGMISGLSLIAHSLDEWISTKEPVCLHLLISAGHIKSFFCSPICKGTPKGQRVFLSLKICKDLQQN